MSNEQNAVQQASAKRAPQSAPGFDPMKFAREVEDKAGNKVLTLELKHKKAWFRMACPNGGMVLNPLRVTDQMAIFEARLFADTEDRTPLASFTATRSADKAAGKQYIRKAQEDALSEALDNAGFGIPLVPMVDSSRQKPSVPALQVETEQKAANDSQTSPLAEPKQANEAPPIQQPKPVDKPTPSSAPAGYKFRRADEKAPDAPAVVDISTGKPAAEESNPAAQQKQIDMTEQPVAEQDAPSPVKEDGLTAYTADMTVEEISQRMTLEQAKKVVVQDGTCKGWTLEQVASDRPSSLKWLQSVCTFADNELKAAAGIVLADLKLKKAG